MAVARVRRGDLILPSLRYGVGYLTNPFRLPHDTCADLSEL